MERTKGISQEEKVLLSFNRIPRLGIHISLRKPTTQASTKQEARIRKIGKQQASELLRLQAYRYAQRLL